MSGIKTCSKCKLSKSLEDFYKDKSNKDGMACQCKSCNRSYIRSPTDNSIKYIKDYPNLTKCKISDCDRCAASSNKKYCHKHQDRLEKYGDPNIVKRRGRKCKTAEEKLETTRKWRKDYSKRCPPSVKIASRCRTRLKKILNKSIFNSEYKDTRTRFSENLGCTPKELQAHIEKQFKPGMNWNNYGFGNDKWHIDHIRPIKDFIVNGEDPRKANHYTNLAPEWQLDNLKKGSKF